MAGSRQYIGWGVLIIGAFGLWEWWKKNHPAGVMRPGAQTALPQGQLPEAVPLTTTAIQTVTSSLPSLNTPASMTTANPAPNPSLAPAGGSVPLNGIDPVTWSTVQKWAQGDGRPPVLQFAMAAVPAEYAGMYDIISNYWDKGVNPIPQPQVDFWNNLRDEYDPSHNYW
jgi:hypothetical protein